MDASDTIWSGIVTQVLREDQCKPHKEQRHSPLAFCSGQLSAAQMGWFKLEKENYAIMPTVKRLHWPGATSPRLDLFTDHNYLIFLFEPLLLVPHLSQSSTRKVLRWAVGLSPYSYNCFQISWLDNVWADSLKCLSAPKPVRRLILVPVLPSTVSDIFCCPSSDEIAKQQKDKVAQLPPEMKVIDGLQKTSNSPIWIPENADGIQLRLCIIAHTGPAGHG